MRYESADLMYPVYHHKACLGYHNRRYEQAHVLLLNRAYDSEAGSAIVLIVQPTYLSDWLRRIETFHEHGHLCKQHFALPGIF